MMPSMIEVVPARVSRTSVKIPGEYAGVSRTFYREWPKLYRALKVLHATPIDRPGAAALVRLVTPSVVTVAFRGSRGRGSEKRVTLPARAGVRADGAPYLRVGIVLHECAHAIAGRHHGMRFCAVLARLVKFYEERSAEAHS